MPHDQIGRGRIQNDVFMGERSFQRCRSLRQMPRGGMDHRAAQPEKIEAFVRVEAQLRDLGGQGEIGPRGGADLLDPVKLAQGALFENHPAVNQQRVIFAVQINAPLGWIGTGKTGPFLGIGRAEGRLDLGGHGAEIRGVVAEQAGLFIKGINPGIGGRLRIGLAMPQIDAPGDPRAPARVIGGDAGDPPHVPTLRSRIGGAGLAHQQDQIARLKCCCGTLQPGRRAAPSDALLHDLLRAQAGPFGSRRQIVIVLENLRHLVRAGDGLDLETLGDRVDITATRARLHGKGQMGRGRHTGAKFIAHRAGQFLHRAAGARCAQPSFARGAFIVERQDIEHDGPAVEQRYRRVRERPGGQPPQVWIARQTLQHGLPEDLMRAAGVADFGQAGPVARGLRAGLFGTGEGIGRFGHDASRMSKLIDPFSGRFLSLSQRRMAAPPGWITPSSISVPADLPRGLKTCGWTLATPSIASAAA